MFMKYVIGFLIIFSVIFQVSRGKLQVCGFHEDTKKVDYVKKKVVKSLHTKPQDTPV